VQQIGLFFCFTLFHMVFAHFLFLSGLVQLGKLGCGILFMNEWCCSAFLLLLILE